MKTRLNGSHAIFRMFAHSLLMLVAGLQLRAAPANDLASKAQDVSGTQLQATGTIVGATAEAREPAHNGYPARRTVWYSWTSPISGTGRIVLTPAQNAGGMHIGIYTGTPFTAIKTVLTEDILGGAKRTSLFGAASGVRYLIAVDGDNVNLGGAFTLNLDVRSTVLTLVSPANLNNWFAPCTFNLEFKMESGKPVRSLDLYDGSTLLKQFLAPPFVYRLTNNFAVVRNIYARATDVDFIQYKSKTNTIDIRNSNDAFKDAIVIDPGVSAGKWSASGLNGSREIGEPLHNRGARDSLWWRWTPTISGTCRLDVTENTSFYSISVYTGSAVNDLKPVTGGL